MKSAAARAHSTDSVSRGRSSNICTTRLAQRRCLRRTTTSEWHEQIVFLRKIVAGGTDKSYGIQVARLAGVPKTVLDRAKEILRNLEESELTPEGNVRQAARHRAEREKLQRLGPPPQLDLFGN